MDWKKNRLPIAAGVFVVATVSAVLTSRSRSGESVAPAPEVEATLPTFEQAEADELVLTRPDDDDLRFRKVDGRWRMQAPADAPADESAVTDALDKLRSLEVTGVVSTNPAVHGRLQITADQAIHAQVKGGGKTLLDVWVGPRKETGTLVRKEGADPVLAVSGSPRYAFTKGAHLYRDRDITDLPAERVTGLALENGEQRFTFVREGAEADWQQAKGEKPIEAFDPSRVAALVSSLTHLRAANFDAADLAPEAAGLTPPQAKVVLTLAPANEGAEPEHVALQLGSLQPGQNEYSLRLEGSNVPFRISKPTGDRLLATPESFTAQQAPPSTAALENAHPAPGQPQLPPEVLQQLQQQLQQQQLQQPH